MERFKAFQDASPLIAIHQKELKGWYFDPYTLAFLHLQGGEREYGENLLHALKIKADLERNRQKASLLETVVQKLKGGEADTKIFLSQCEEENIKNRENDGG